MRGYEGASCDDVYRQAARDILECGREQESRDQTTKEVLHASFSVSAPRDRIVFARPINPAFAIVEVLWILAGRRDEAYLHFWNPRMSQFSNEDGDLCGYGYRLRKHFNTDQLEDAVRALRTHEDSRQVVLQIWDPREDLPDPQPRAKDVPCNVTSHLMLRQGELEWLQVMRSNDLIWGTPYNFVQFTTLHEVLTGWLEADVGRYSHVSSSLHVYRRHWDHLEAIPGAPVPPDEQPADLRLPLEEWEEVAPDLLDLPEQLSEADNPSSILNLVDGSTHLPKGYQQLAAVLGMEALRRNDCFDQALELLPDAGGYWGESWVRWAHRKENGGADLRGQLDRQS